MIRRILCLDGGGLKGTFSVSFLANLEIILAKKCIGDYFDLIVGTSTGGIIALGLGFGFSAKELLGLYESFGPRIFSGNRSWRFLRWFGPGKYEPDRLREVLFEQFGDLRLRDARRRIVVPSFNLGTGEVYVYKTPHHPKLKTDLKELIVDVAMATAAAPTYFPPQGVAKGIPLVDGGLWANNPAGLAVVEAISILGWQREDFRVLSIGCTRAPLDIGWGKRGGWGWHYWALRIPHLFGVAQSSGSLGTAELLAGKDHVFRVDPVVPPGKLQLDSLQAIPILKGLGETVARSEAPKLEPVFFGETAEPFVPLC